MNIHEMTEQKKKIIHSVYGLLTLAFVVFIMIIVVLQLQVKEIDRWEEIATRYHLKTSEKSLKILRSIDDARLFFRNQHIQDINSTGKIKGKSLSLPLILEYSLRDKINGLRYEVEKFVKDINLSQLKFENPEFKNITLIFNESHAKFDTDLAKFESKEYYSYQYLDNIFEPLIAVADQLSRLHDHAYQKVLLQIEKNEKENLVKNTSLIFVLVIIGVIGVIRLLSFVNNVFFELSVTQKKIYELNKTLEKRVHQRTEELENTLLLLTKENKQRKTAEEQAKKSSQAKSDFLSRMSHELRTPMNSILGFAQIMELDSQELNESQTKNVKEILDAGNYLLELINELLDLVEIEAGKLDVSMGKVQLSEVLKQCMALMQPITASRQVKQIDNVSDKGYILHADFFRLKQAFINLLSNAVKYNRENGTIIIDSEVIDEQRLRINITDTGEGIAKEDVSKLFTSFERLNTEFNVEGAGIGLIITKNIIELMDGKIGVDSILGEGSTFWVELGLFKEE